jgi:hypothetical protein
MEVSPMVSPNYNKYGPVVRISPKAVSCVSAEAWNDNFTARPQLIKDLKALTLHMLR